MPLIERLPPSAARLLRLARRRSNVVMFVAGFLFDFLTMQRIDAWTDLIIQLAYLSSLTGLLVYQHREARGVWKPGRLASKWWAHNVEVLHFFYGGLLSAYVVLYFKSSTGARPVIFFCFLVALMFFNEMPQVRRAGHRLRLGLYSFCVLSFLNYFVPIVIGRMGGWVFALALLLSAAVVWRVADWLAALDADRARSRARLFAPAAAVFVVVGGLYLFRLIPPVPLSVQFQGIYHDVDRDGQAYRLVYERPSILKFWRRDSRPFHSRAGDRMHFFARIFAPTRFRHQVIIRWELWDPVRKVWMTSDRIPLNIVGGRAEGFRGVAIKSNFVPGRWRVIAETQNGRAISMLRFRVEADTRERDRRWRVLRG